jgi:uncharacterized membrane protein YraQ (UPF0718 family)
MFKALGNSSRSEITKYLVTHPECITGDIVQFWPLAQATVSQHLKVLREAGWIIGSMEALITRYVPQAAIAGISGERNALAVPLAALIGIPSNLSNFTALPIVSGLLAQGMQPGAAIASLIAGPVTTIPAMVAVHGIVQKRVFVLYFFSLGLFGATVMGVAANFLLG